MPIYEYRCMACEEVFQRFMSISDYDKPVDCACGGSAKKLISRCSFINEGSEHRDIDCIVGADAERKWNLIHERKKARQKSKQNKTV